jgi:hypothetical protein
LGWADGSQEKEEEAAPTGAALPAALHRKPLSQCLQRLGPALL